MRFQFLNSGVRGDNYETTPNCTKLTPAPIFAHARSAILVKQLLFLKSYTTSVLFATLDCDLVDRHF